MLCSFDTGTHVLVQREREREREGEGGSEQTRCITWRGATVQFSSYVLKSWIEGMHNNKNPDIRMPKLTKSTEFSTAQALMRSICDRTGDISCLQAKSGKFYEPMGLVKRHAYLTPLHENGSLHRAYHRCGLSLRSFYVLFQRQPLKPCPSKTWSSGW